MYCTITIQSFELGHQPSTDRYPRAVTLSHLGPTWGTAEGIDLWALLPESG